MHINKKNSDVSVYVDQVDVLLWLLDNLLGWLYNFFML